jgi:putative redox protein
MVEVTVAATNVSGTYRTEIVIDTGNHVLVSDEPLEMGGTHAGPESHSLLASSLAACIAMTLRMYADRKKWPLDSTQAQISLHTENKAGAFQTYFDVSLTLSGPLDGTQRARLLEIAGRCPIHKILDNPIHIRTVLLD